MSAGEVYPITVLLSCHVRLLLAAHSSHPTQASSLSNPACQGFPNSSDSSMECDVAQVNGHFVRRSAEMW
jgi:hypothetical protein